MKMNIASYNIWHAQDYVLKLQEIKKIAPENIVDFICDNDIAICGMNEVDVRMKRSGWIDTPAVLARMLTEKTGQTYYSVFAAGIEYGNEENSEYGNAIISRYPLQNVRKIKVDTGKGIQGGYEPRSVVIADVAAEGKILTVMATHFGLKEDERWLMLEKISDVIKSNPYPLIFMGDFNTGPMSAVYDEIAKMLKDTSKDKAVPLTFPSYGPRSKIDYIFTSADIETSGEHIVELKCSDHYPLMTTMEW